MAVVLSPSPGHIVHHEPGGSFKASVHQVFYVAGGGLIGGRWQTVQVLVSAPNPVKAPSICGLVGLVVDAEVRERNDSRGLIRNIQFHPTQLVWQRRQTHKC